MRKLFVLLLAAVSWSATAEPELSFIRDDKNTGISLEDLSNFSPAKELRVWETHEGIEITYRAIALRPLLQKMFGNEWLKPGELVFTCKDGYAPSVPTSAFEKGYAYIAYARADAKPFVVQNRAQNEKNVPLGPYYLIWDNVAHPELKKQPRSRWPYQIVSIEMVNFQARYPGLAPAINAPKILQDGFAVFRASCLPCHTVNGVGGGKAPELNYPVSVTEYLSEAWLMKWILAPASVRFNTNMPALDEGMNDRAGVARSLVAYLKDVAKRKRKPVVSQAPEESASR